MADKTYGFHAIDLSEFQTGYLLGILDRFMKEVPLDDVEKKWITDIRDRVWSAVERDQNYDPTQGYNAEETWRFAAHQVQELREAGAPADEMRRWDAVAYHLSWHMFNMEGK